MKNCYRIPQACATDERSTMNATVKSFAPLVDFLEAVLSSNSEIALHDFSDPDHSIIDIRNAHVSGRKIGAPATDLAIKIMNGAYADRDFVAGYTTRSAGNKALRSASFIIREDGRCVGMLCINTDVSLLTRLDSVVQQIVEAYGGVPSTERPAASETPAAPVLPIPAMASGAHEVESLTDSTQDLIARNIEDLAAERGLAVDKLGQAERIDIIRALNANGMFLLKGAVASCAETMGISEPSVYRYLQKVRKEG